MLTKYGENHPRAHEIYSNIALSYNRYGNHDTALSIYSKAFDLAPGNLIIMANMACLKIDLKLYSVAIMEYNSLISIDSLNHRYYLSRGAAYQFLGDTASALIDYYKALSIAPDFYLPIQNIAFTYADQNKLDKAIILISDAINRKSNDAELYGLRSEMYLKNKEYLKAQKDIKRSLRLDKTVPHSYVIKCEILLELDQEKQAKKSLSKSLRYVSDSTYILSLYKKYNF